MNNFFQKIPKSLVVLAFVLSVLPGYTFAVEGDSDPVPPDVIPPVSEDGSDLPVEDVPAVPPDTAGDGSDLSAEDAPAVPPDTAEDGSDLPAEDAPAIPPDTPEDGSDLPAEDAPATLPDAPGDGSDLSAEDAPAALPDVPEDGSDLPSTDVTVNVEKHDTFSVASSPADTPDTPSGTPDSAEPPALVQTIRSLFGSYTPRTQTVTTYYDGQPIAAEEQIIPGLAGLDFEWLAGVGLFALITFCLFRILGGIVRNG